METIEQTLVPQWAKTVCMSVRINLDESKVAREYAYTVIHLLVVDVSCVLVWDHAH